jgi:octaprenyl-diphosphate synthase
MTPKGSLRKYCSDGVKEYSRNSGNSSSPRFDNTGQMGYDFLILSKRKANGFLLADGSERMMHIIMDLIGNELAQVEDEFKRNLKSKVPLISKIGEHLLLSGGKRFRPSILILSAKLCGYQGRRQIQAASVIEFIHTASLLHDDVVDDAELRRGNKSANSRWGSEASVLVGDFLLSKSFCLMVDDGDLKILNTISRATTQMAEGEIQELMKASDLSVTEDEYLSIVTNKTASLISATCQIGAILGGVDGKKEQALANFGMNLGISFQLMDDSLDYTSTEKRFGKEIGIDLYGGKITLPLIHTLRSCSPSEREKVVEIVLSKSSDERAFLSVVDLINRYGGIEYTLEKARGYVAKAKGNLDCFHPSREKTVLLAMANYVVERTW